MRADIEKRIRDVYPTERLYEPQAEQYFGTDYDDRLWNTLGEVAGRTAVQLGSNLTWEKRQENQYAFTLDADPHAPEWIWSPRQEKLRIIAERGRNVPVFWLPVSRVFPTYVYYYNIWKPRGDTGYLDAEISYAPFDADWATFHEILFSTLERAGLERLPESELHELVPFVFDLECDDDDDDDSDVDLDDEGHLVPANVYQCLFGEP